MVFPALGNLRLPTGLLSLCPIQVYVKVVILNGPQFKENMYLNGVGFEMLGRTSVPK